MAANYLYGINKLIQQYNLQNNKSSQSQIQNQK